MASETSSLQTGSSAIQSASPGFVEPGREFSAMMERIAVLSFAPERDFDQFFGPRVPGFGGSTAPPAKHCAIDIHCVAIGPRTSRLTSAMLRPWVTT